MFCEERKGIVIKFGRPTKYFFYGSCTLTESGDHHIFERNAQTQLSNCFYCFVTALVSMLTLMT